ncbi:alcohol dehydrogenase catalytic domain-containing protein [Phytoactinopolyspora alkaliphila]|uniref:Alcohol dehydrogenase catalytic domain-containing protein n=1 Tax=Phytoactinopolyspora alkaliphila TaxID=1783498 RepID=A0A6N9YNH7_9ACTN|nr:alcohol dehydrogenase catalytic domain-containing protein [Phytoactinopolyspora alkaliphila]NED96553.1 alcohol dehydrogenase catalytic domain-containing protein [Phytoactinopolyspora alkaliphila]
MKAVTWQGKRDVRVDEVPDPRIEEPTDAIIRVTTTALCGSDLHLYEPLSPFMQAGDILGHESIGVVEEVGGEVSHIVPGDRVVVPFQICCGTCFMCTRGLHTQCETTQVREQGMGAAIYGYTKLYGQVPGGQAQYMRVQQAQYAPIKVPDGPDERFVYLSDVLPTAWQAVEYADTPEGGTLLVLGLGPIGDMACRIALHRGYRVIGVDPVPERRTRVAQRGAEILHPDLSDVGDTVREMTGGRGADAVIDAVGMEAHGSVVAHAAHKIVGMLPSAIAEKVMERAGIDRLAAFYLAIDAVRRGGTISLAGVYGGMTDPLPMLTLFDKQVQVRMGQANVRRWSDDILALVAADGDPLGVESFHTHRLPLDEAPQAYEMFQQKKDGAVKVLFTP